MQGLHHPQTLSSEYRLVGCLSLVTVSGCPQAELSAELSNWSAGEALGSAPPQAAAPDSYQGDLLSSPLFQVNSPESVLGVWIKLVQNREKKERERENGFKRQFTC